jgi:hypothetical protein
LIVDVFIEGERIDLFEDEQINIRSSVQDINDISKLFADFSQSFTVPASDNNNRIFQHYYQAEIDNGYDARTRKQAFIYVDTLDFKRGKMRLDKVSMKHNQPENYRITFFGDVIKIKDLIGNDKLDKLVWLDNFSHAYSEAIVKTGLTDGIDFTVATVLYPDAIIYPLISYQRQYLYDTTSTDFTSSDTLVNIAYQSNRTDGVSYVDLKPAIKLSIVMKAIEEQYGLTFSGDFLESAEFTNIYMNLNKRTETLAAGNLLFESESGVTVGELSVSNDRLQYRCTITPKTGFTNVKYKIKLTVNDTVVYESTDWLTGTNTKDGYVQVVPVDYVITAEVITQSNFQFNANTRLQIVYPGSNNNIVYEQNSYINQVIALTANITNELPDIKVYELITTLFKMFNLVVVPDGDAIGINDLQGWYAEGQIHDITPYIDTRKEEISRGKIHNEINFRFEESDQILADEYLQSNKQVYGNLEFKLTNSTGGTLNDVDGDALDIEVLFENPIFERLFNLEDNTETVIQYCPYFNREIKPIAGNPFLFYAPSVSVAANPIGFVSTTYSQINTNIFMPSHSRQIDTESFNLNFNSELNEYTSSIFEDTIYSRYYKDYITDIFSDKRRVFNYDAILPNSLLNTLKLNDRLIIRDRRYIINSINSNLVERKDQLELINDIYDAPLASDLLSNTVFTPTFKVYNSAAWTDTTRYIGLTGKTISKVDSGDGVTWLTVTETITASGVQTIHYSIDANISGISRSVQIQVVDGINDPKFTIIQDTSFNPSLDFSDFRNSQNLTFITIGLN